jgi:hypothetical protein
MDINDHISNQRGFAMNDTAKTTGDLISLGAILLSLLKLMPEIAALAAFIWTIIRIYETRTVQKLLGKKPYTRKTDHAGYDDDDD